MLLLKYFHETKKFKTLFDGDLGDCVQKYQELTEKYEQKGIMMVQELSCEGVFVREFASAQEGRLFDLIIVGGVVEKVKTIESNE